MKRLHSQTGFGLMEVLVAVAVLSVGLLGASLLSNISLRGTAAAEQRALGVMLANDLADRLRRNPAAVRSGMYARLFPGALSAPAVPACAAEAAGCSGDALATADAAAWIAAARQHNPDLTTTVTCDTTSSTFYSCHILLGWQERTQAAGEAAGGSFDLVAEFVP